MTYDVQLTVHGAEVWKGDELVLDIWAEDFKQLAEAFADAAITARGKQSVTCRAEEVRLGDTLLGREVINVRNESFSIGQTSITTKPFGWMVFESDHMVTVERVIE